MFESIFHMHVRWDDARTQNWNMNNRNFMWIRIRFARNYLAKNKHCVEKFSGTKSYCKASSFPLTFNKLRHAAQLTGRPAKRIMLLQSLESHSISHTMVAKWRSSIQTFIVSCSEPRVYKRSDPERSIHIVMLSDLNTFVYHVSSCPQLVPSSQSTVFAVCSSLRAKVAQVPSFNKVQLFAVGMRCSQNQ